MMHGFEIRKTQNGAAGAVRSERKARKENMTEDASYFGKLGFFVTYLLKELP
jgi:hypothetical protein